MLGRVPKNSRLTTLTGLDFSFRVPLSKVETPNNFDRGQLGLDLKINLNLASLRKMRYDFVVSFVGFPGVKESNKFFYRDTASNADSERNDKAWALYYLSSLARLIQEGNYSIELHKNGKIQLRSKYEIEHDIGLFQV